MTRGLSPKSVALTDQILATLADEGGLPISTPDLWRKISPDRPRAERLAAIEVGEYVPPSVPYGDIHRMLNRLAGLGEVEKIIQPELRACYWRRWPEPQPDAGPARSGGGAMTAGQSEPQPGEYTGDVTGGTGDYLPMASYARELPAEAEGAWWPAITGTEALRPAPVQWYVLELPPEALPADRGGRDLEAGK